MATNPIIPRVPVGFTTKIEPPTKIKPPEVKPQQPQATRPTAPASLAPDRIVEPPDPIDTQAAAQQAQQPVEPTVAPPAPEVTQVAAQDATVAEWTPPQINTPFAQEVRNPLPNGVPTQATGGVGNVLAQSGRLPGGIAQGVIKTLAAPGVLIEAAKQNTADFTANLPEAQAYVAETTQMAGGYATQADLINAVASGEITQQQADSYIQDWQANGAPIDQAQTNQIMQRGSEPISKPITNIAGKANTAIQGWTDSWVPAPESGAAQFAATAFDAAGEAVPAVATALATGGSSALFGGTVLSRTMGALNAASTDVLEQGGDFGSALTIGALEYASETIGGKLFDQTASKIASAGTGAAKAAGAAINVAGEGLEENISGIGNAILTGNSYGLSDAITDFGIGAAVGGIMQGGISAANAVSNTVAQLQGSSSNESQPEAPKAPEMPRTQAEIDLVFDDMFEIVPTQHDTIPSAPTTPSETAEAPAPRILEFRSNPNDSVDEATPEGIPDADSLLSLPQSDNSPENPAIIQFVRSSENVQEAGQSNMARTDLPDTGAGDANNGTTVESDLDNDEGFGSGINQWWNQSAAPEVEIEPRVLQTATATEEIAPEEVDEAETMSADEILDDINAVSMEEAMENAIGGAVDMETAMQEAIGEETMTLDELLESVTEAPAPEPAPETQQEVTTEEQTDTEAETQQETISPEQTRFPDFSPASAPTPLSTTTIPVVAPDERTETSVESLPGSDDGSPTIPSIFPAIMPGASTQSVNAVGFELESGSELQQNPSATPEVVASAQAQADAAAESEAQAEPQSETELARQIWTPTQQQIGVQDRRDRDRSATPGSSGLFRGEGNRGQIDVTQSYNSTFNGLSSY